jgi:hypothetical protein
MGEYLTLITVMVSGLFGLLVAVATSILANRREVITHRRHNAKETYEEVKATYCDSLASLEKCIRYITRDSEFPNLEAELASSSAMLQLIATEPILEQNVKVSDLMHAWSTEFIRGEPKKFAGSNTVTISSQDKPHRERAKALYPELTNACTDLANLMRDHLASLRKQRDLP